jgi:hypothetical protein
MRIETLMSKSVDSAEAQEFFKKLPGKVKRDKSDEDVYYIHKEAAVEIVATDGLITGIFLYPRYALPVPAKLSFGMSKDQVKKLMGKPDKVNDLGEQQWECDDYRLGVAWQKDKISMIYLSSL